MAANYDDFHNCLVCKSTKPMTLNDWLTVGSPNVVGFALKQQIRGLPPSWTCKSSPIIPRNLCLNPPQTLLWHLPARQSSEAAPANSVPVPENESSTRLRWMDSGEAEPCSQPKVVRGMPDEMGLAKASWTLMADVKHSSGWMVPRRRAERMNFPDFLLR